MIEVSIALVITLMLAHFNNIFINRQNKKTAAVVKELKAIEKYILKADTLSECAFWKNELHIIERLHGSNNQLKSRINCILQHANNKQRVLQNKKKNLYAVN